jgi:hypothetical protein
MNETCDLCGAVFGSPASLIEHQRTAHPRVDPASDVEVNPEAHRAGLVCALCGHRFPTARALAEHNLRPHPAPASSRRSGPVPG